MLKRDLGFGHGDANTLTHHVLQSDGQSTVKEVDAALIGWIKHAFVSAG